MASIFTTGGTGFVFYGVGLALITSADGENCIHGERLACAAVALDAGSLGASQLQAFGVKEVARAPLLSEGAAVDITIQTMSARAINSMYNAHLIRGLTASEAVAFDGASFYRRWSQDR